MSTSPVNSSTLGCDEGTVMALQSSIFLHISEIIMLILALIAVPILLVAIGKCVNDSRFHANIRIITAVHCISILLHCIGRIIQHSSDLYLWLAPLSTCDRRQYLGVCIVSRGLYTFGIYNSSFTTVSMAVERTVATYVTKKYEHKKSEYGIAMIAVQVFSSIVVTTYLFWGTELQIRPVYCILNSQKAWAMVVDLISLSSNFFAFIQCGRMYNINMRLRTSTTQTDLSQKYQIEENKTLIQIILRFTCLDFIFMVLYFLTTLIMEIHPFQSLANTIAVFELVHCAPVYAIVVVLAMSRIIRQIHSEKLVRLSAEVQVKDEAYFYFLKQQWSHVK